MISQICRILSISLYLVAHSHQEKKKKHIFTPRLHLRILVTLDTSNAFITYQNNQAILGKRGDLWSNVCGVRGEGNES